MKNKIKKLIPIKLKRTIKIILQKIKSLPYVLMYNYYKKHTKLNEKKVLFLSSSRNTLSGNFLFIYNELKKYTDNYLFEKNWGYGNLLNEFDVRAVNNDTVYLGWNDIKWYDYEDYEDVNAIVYGLKYLEENDYSYRFARLGEDYDDFEEKYYDSDSEKENHLEFPSVLREFEDEYIMDLLKVNDNLEK